MFDNVIAAMLQQFSSEEKQSQGQIQQELENLRIRNQQRMAQIKADMGEKYILHPSHTKTRLDTPRPV